jgi:ParB family chromosome partitioning protein
MNLSLQTYPKVSVPMSAEVQTAELEWIDVDLVDRNRENPRIVFRQKEMDNLMESISLHGVLQPISVYKDRRRYVIIDGERRWRCSRKLNIASIPALVQPKPSPLDNLLIMFNVHSLREQWNLLTIAVKLPRVIELLEAELERKPTETELSEKTGLPRATIRRSKLLIDLPDEHIERLLDELKKPKSQQRLSEDLFIEMERALGTVERALPGLIKDKEKVRKVLLEKYENNVIPNIVHFRDLAKIARAENVDADKTVASRVLNKVFTPNSYSITQAYEASVSAAYLERDVKTRVEALTDRLEGLDVAEVDEEMAEKLKTLIKLATKLVRGRA